MNKRKREQHRQAKLKAPPKQPYISGRKRQAMTEQTIARTQNTTNIEKAFKRTLSDPASLPKLFTEVRQPSRTTITSPKSPKSLLSPRVKTMLREICERKQSLNQTFTPKSPNGTTFLYPKKHQMIQHRGITETPFDNAENMEDDLSKGWTPRYVTVKPWAQREP